MPANLEARGQCWLTMLFSSRGQAQEAAEAERGGLGLAEAPAGTGEWGGVGGWGLGEHQRSSART